MLLETTIQATVDTGSPVIVDFWRDGCQPCKGLERQLDVLKEKHPEVKIVKINTNEATEELLAEYNVRNVPTVILFKDKQQVGRTGAVPASKLIDMLGL